MSAEKTLSIKFCGLEKPRAQFLKEIRFGVMGFTKEGPMRLEALLSEIGKNVYDHAEGKGHLTIIRQEDGSLLFEIADEGTAAHDFAECRGRSTKAGNGVNYGVGLDMIPDMANSLGIDLKIDTSRGFRYSGVYTPKPRA